MFSLVKPPASSVMQSLVALLLTAVVLFASAGRLGIAAFWWYLAVLCAVSGIGLLIIDPDLARERMRPGGRRLPSKYLFVALVPLAHWAIAGLDRGRLHWSDTVATALQVAGLALFALALSVVLWAMHVNRFFSSVARIQGERGHHVIVNGPYQWVRHPGYAAAIIAALASGVALGSWFSTAIAAIAVPLLLWRTHGEDRLLEEGLPGYKDYAERVRYKLAPGIW